jgi:hypothetical protein
MVEIDVDIDTISRKELQALAKKFGIKANQKSVFLRDRLREVIAVVKQDEDENYVNGEERTNEENPTKDGNENESLLEDTSENANEESEKFDGRTSSEFSAEVTSGSEFFAEKETAEIIAPDETDLALTKSNRDDNECDLSEASVDDISIVCEEGKIAEKENENDCSKDINVIQLAFTPNNDIPNANFCKSKEVENAEEDIISHVNEDTQIIMQSNEKGESMEANNVVIADQDATKAYENAKKPVEEKVEPKVSQLEATGMNKVTTKVIEENAESIETSKIENFASNNREVKSHQSTNNRLKTAMGKQQKEVPLWKVHSTDFLRNRGPDDNKRPQVKKYQSTNDRLAMVAGRQEKEVPSWKVHSADFLRKKGKPPQTKILQSTDNGLKTVTAAQQKEVPLWKVHSTDFLRKRGTDKNRSVHLGKKKQPPRKHSKRLPLGDRSNKKVEVNVAISKGDKIDAKKFTPKQLPMSKRNEEQMKKFLERQTVGRQDRAKREEVKMYANCVRN